MQAHRNTYFNFAGNAIVALSLLVATPFYLRLLGAEAFGLVGVMYTVTALLSVADPGLAATLTRELSRISPNSTNSNDQYVLARSMELMCAGVCCAVCIAAMLLLPLLGQQWFKLSNLDKDVLAQSLSWIALHAGLQILTTFYGSGLQGLQLQMQFNAIAALAAVLRGVVTVLGLAFGWLDIVSFFVCHALISILHLLVVRHVLWYSMPKLKWQISCASFARIRHHALGMWCTALLGVFLTQIDKIVLSRAISLESFGYYVLAWNVAMLVIKPALPVYNAYFPQLSQLASQLGHEERLSRIYHEASSRNAIFIWPIALSVAVLSYPILLIYTGSESIAQQTYLVLSSLVVGSALNATMLMPYALAQAYGWVSFTIKQNLIACLAMLPLCMWVMLDPSLERASLCWLLVNLGYVSIAVPLLHKKILPGQAAHWYLLDNRLRYFLPRKWVALLMKS